MSSNAPQMSTTRKIYPRALTNLTGVQIDVSTGRVIYASSGAGGNTSTIGVSSTRRLYGALAPKPVIPTIKSITINATPLADPVPFSVTISGRYFDPNNNGINGATLYLFENINNAGFNQIQSTTTATSGGNAGSYSFTVNISSPIGTYVFDVSDNTNND